VQPELIQRLKWGSTWALVGLSVITFGVYLVFYARRQTLILNESSAPENRISLNFITVWFVITFSSLALLFIYVFVPADSPMASISNLSDRLDNLMDLIWAFMARGAFHKLLQSQKETPAWFHGFWTFLFQAFYFNFKINKLSEFPPVPPPPR
jgi:hypothetical protein